MAYMKTHLLLHQHKGAGRVRALNGGCLAPPLSFENIGSDIRREFAELHLPITRLHDAPLENPGLNLVDVPMIFPLFHADPDNPLNYNFKATDDYIANCLSCGTQVFYRLGVSIDHSYNKYVIEPPRDPGKWVEIVSHIIRHYNEGWADGFHHGIQYWEIWNEAEGISGEGRHLHTMWNAPVESYYEFYSIVSAKLKSRFPELKIGGPSNCQWEENGEHRSFGREFIDLCAERHLPLDFYSIHLYGTDIEWMSGQFREIRTYLDKKGFEKTELHCTEWAYMPQFGFSRMRESPEKKLEVVLEMKDSNAAAFTAGCLIDWQDQPLDMGYLYTVTGTDFGLFMPVTMLPGKKYYGMKAFGELARFYPRRLQIEAEHSEARVFPQNSERREYAFRVLAGGNESGGVAVLVSLFNYGRQKIEMEFDHPEELEWVTVELLDRTHNLSRILELHRPIGAFTLDVEEQSAVLLIKASGRKYQ